MTSEDRAIVRTSAVARGALFVTSLGYPQCSGSHATLSTIVTLPGYASLCVADKNLTFLFFFFFAVSRKYIIEHSLCSPGRCRNCFARGTVVWRRDGFHVGGKRWNTQCVCFTFSLSLSLGWGRGDDGIGSRLFRIYVVFVSRGPLPSKQLLLHSSFPTSSVTARLGAG